MSDLLREARMTLTEAEHALFALGCVSAAHECQKTGAKIDAALAAAAPPPAPENAKPVVECPNCCNQNGDLTCETCGDTYDAQAFASTHYGAAPPPDLVQRGALQTPDLSHSAPEKGGGALHSKE